MAVKYTFLLFLFLGSLPPLFGQDQKEQYSSLMEQGSEFREEKKHAEAIKVFSKAELIAEKNEWPDKLFDAKINIGFSYNELSNYGEAIHYFQEALGIIGNTPDAKKKATVLVNIGVVYSENDNYAEALGFYKRAYELFQKSGTKYQKIIAAVNIADAYNKLGEYDKAMKIIEESKDVKAKPVAINIWKTVYAETLFYKGEIKKAEKIAEKVYSEIKNEKTGACTICVLDLLSKIYIAENKIDKAIVYINRALKYDPELGHRIERYERLANLYHKKGEMAMTIAYKDSVIHTKDLLSEEINRELFQSNKVKYNVFEYQNQLNINKERYESKMLIMWIVIVLGLALFFFIYSWQKNRIAKHREKRINIENKQKIVKLELQELQNDVAEKNRRLSARALYLSGRNELIEEVMLSLEKLPEVENNIKIKQYIKNLKGYLRTDAEWDKFIAHFEKVNPDFIKKLKTEHPKLSSHDIRFLCYLYMNLDTKEMSIIFNITEEASRKRKQRIAKKMDLDTDDLHQYILTLS